jgi:hypothetical protein
VVPVAYPAGMVVPHHVNPGAAFFFRNRIGIFNKLVFNGEEETALAPVEIGGLRIAFE